MYIISFAALGSAPLFLKPMLAALHEYLITDLNTEKKTKSTVQKI